MKAHAHRWIVVAAIISLGAGAALSHAIEPSVRVEKVMLTGNTPTVRIFPATPGPYPIALLAHGATGSKESNFPKYEATEDTENTERQTVVVATHRSLGELCGYVIK